MSNPIDDPIEFVILPKMEQDALVKLINSAFEHGALVSNLDSYILKHTIEQHEGMYVTNGAFKGAMLLCGFFPVDTTSKNWKFKIRARWDK